MECLCYVSSSESHHLQDTALVNWRKHNDHMRHVHSPHLVKGYDCNFSSKTDRNVSLNSHLTSYICTLSPLITIVACITRRTPPPTSCLYHCSEGIDKRRSMTRNQNRDDASSRKRITSYDNGAPWSDLNHHLLSLVMMQLGVIDLLAFAGVCKSWRSLALDNKNIYMASRPPMLMSISDRSCEKECCLEDFEGRKFKTILPHSAGRTCIGLTCGFLILYGRETRDFWLVNPVTRDEFHFPCFPFCANIDPARVRAILVHSLSVPRWTFVLLHRSTYQIWFSIAGSRAWNQVSSTFLIQDLHAFKGKIYTLNTGFRVYEMRFDPEPKLTLLRTMNYVKPSFLCPEFVSLDENLCVLDRRSKGSFMVIELDVEEMKWVALEKTIREYTVFVNNLKYSAAIRRELWVDHRSQYKRYTHFLANIDKSQNGGWFASYLWYFAHECLNVNLIHE